jgi:hypothetical protein
MPHRSIPEHRPQRHYSVSLQQAAAAVFGIDAVDAAASRKDKEPSASRAHNRPPS